MNQLVTVGFLVNSIMLGLGLAMDAFSVSMADGLNYPGMTKREMGKIAGVFALFQAGMPMLGWFCVHTVLLYFQAFEKVIPWIALLLLAYIGGKMIYDGSRNEEQEMGAGIGMGALCIQGIATSIDALSVGFTIADYSWGMALACAGVIALVTFILCIGGLVIGHQFGTKIAGKATILGGVILIIIGLEIFLTKVMF